MAKTARSGRRRTGGDGIDGAGPAGGLVEGAVVGGSDQPTTATAAARPKKAAASNETLTAAQLFGIGLEGFRDPLQAQLEMLIPFLKGKGTQKVPQSMLDQCLDLAAKEKCVREWRKLTDKQQSTRAKEIKDMEKKAKREMAKPSGRAARAKQRGKDQDQREKEEKAQEKKKRKAERAKAAEEKKQQAKAKKQKAVEAAAIPKAKKKSQHRSVLISPSNSSSASSSPALGSGNSGDDNDTIGDDNVLMMLDSNDATLGTSAGGTETGTSSFAVSTGSSVAGAGTRDRSSTVGTATGTKTTTKKHTLLMASDEAREQASTMLESQQQLDPQYRRSNGDPVTRRSHMTDREARSKLTEVVESIFEVSAEIRKRTSALDSAVQEYSQAAGLGDTSVSSPPFEFILALVNQYKPPRTHGEHPRGQEWRERTMISMHLSERDRYSALTAICSKALADGDDDAALASFSRAEADGKIVRGSENESSGEANDDGGVTSQLHTIASVAAALGFVDSNHVESTAIHEEEEDAVVHAYIHLSQYALDQVGSIIFKFYNWIKAITPPKEDDLGSTIRWPLLAPVLFIIDNRKHGSDATCHVLAGSSEFLSRATEHISNGVPSFSNSSVSTSLQASYQIENCHDMDSARDKVINEDFWERCRPPTTECLDDVITDGSHRFKKLTICKI